MGVLEVGDDEEIDVVEVDDADDGSNGGESGGNGGSVRLDGIWEVFGITGDGDGRF